MKFELYRARRGLLLRTQWRWKLLANNREPIAVSSEGYNNQADALRSIELVRDSADASIDEVR